MQSAQSVEHEEDEREMNKSGAADRARLGMPDHTLIVHQPGKLACLWIALLSTFFALQLHAAEERLHILWQDNAVTNNPSAIIRLALTPAFDFMAGQYGNRVFRWNARTGKRFDGLGAPPTSLEGEFDVTHIAFIGTDLLFAGFSFPEVKPQIVMWDGISPEARSWRGMEFGVLNAVAYHSDTERIATAGDLAEGGSLRIHAWDSLIPTNQISISGRPKTVQFSPSGEWVLAAGDGLYGVLVWRPTPPSQSFLLHPPDDYSQSNASLARIDSMAVSRDSLVAYGGSLGILSEQTFFDVPGVIFVHRLPNGEVIHALQGHAHPVGPVAFIGTGEVLMSMDGVTVRFWHMSDGRSLLVLPGPAMGYPQEFANGALLVAPDTTWFAIHGPDKGQVTVYRMPVLLTHSTLVNGQVELRWVGGSGRYQVQRSATPDAVWENIGEVQMDRVALVPASADRGCFRVVSLEE